MCTAATSLRSNLTKESGSEWKFITIQLKDSSSQRKKKRRLVSFTYKLCLISNLDFNLEDDDEMQDEAELVESLLEEFDDM
jgi:hypothetical protein